MKKLIIVLLALACLLVSGCSKQELILSTVDIYYSDYSNYRVFVRLDNCDLQHEGYANRYAVYDTIANLVDTMRLYNTELVIEAHTTDDDYEVFDIPAGTFTQFAVTVNEVYDDLVLTPKSTYADYDKIFLYDYVEHYQNNSEVYLTDSQESWLVYKGLFGGIDLPNKNELPNITNDYEFLDTYISHRDIQGLYTIHVSVNAPELKVNTIFEQPEYDICVTSYSGNIQADVLTSINKGNDDRLHVIFSEDHPVLMFESTEAKNLQELITSGNITFIDSRVFNAFILED